MKPGSKKVTLMLFAAILMLTLIQLPFAPSASATGSTGATSYTMPGTKMTFTDTDGPGWTAPGTTPVGRNITTAYYNYDVAGNSLRFQVNLAGTNVESNWTNNDRMFIFINYKAGGNISGTNSNTGAPAGLVGMDYYLELSHTTSGSGTWALESIKYYGPSDWTEVPATGNGNGVGVNAALIPKWYASEPNSTSLQWKIPLGGLYNPTAVPFDFYVVTSPSGFAGYGTGATTDVTPKFHTPIPSAAWLLGSGLIGLIGLKRRKARLA